MNPCQNGGDCREFFGGFLCDCEAGFDGEFCQIGMESFLCKIPAFCSFFLPSFENFKLISIPFQFPCWKIIKYSFMIAGPQLHNCVYANYDSLAFMNRKFWVIKCRFKLENCMGVLGSLSSCFKWKIREQKPLWQPYWRVPFTSPTKTWRVQYKCIIYRPTTLRKLYFTLTNLISET